MVLRPTRRPIPQGGGVRRSAVAVQANGRAVVLGADAAVARKRLGPVAWCVLEALVAATDTHGVAHGSIRSIASDLGVSKNTVQRAMTALRAAALVAPVAARRDDGRFAAGVYGVHVASSVLGLVDTGGVNVTQPDASSASSSPAVDSPKSFRSRRRRLARPLDAEQLSLLET